VSAPSGEPAGGRDWDAWHLPYDDPDSPLSHRLAVVQRAIADCLAEAPPGPIPVVSMCAGQGRDLLGVLPGHPRASDVTARLVEADERNAARAREAAAAAGLGGVEVVTGDASTTGAYRGAVPAQLVLVCGVFGNISWEDICVTVDHLPELCAARATVVWTRHRRPPDLTPAIRRRFAEAGFEERAFVGPDGFVFGVGVHRLTADPRPCTGDRRLFTFTGDGSRPA